MSHQHDACWEHGVNQHPGWTCNYCRLSRSGGGATRFKQHLAGRGAEVVHCASVPPEVRDYFRRALDKTVEKKRMKQKERILREEAAAEGNVEHDVDSDDDEDLQRGLHASRQEEEYARRVREQGGEYEYGGGSSQQHSGGGGLFGKLKRSTSRKGKAAPVQTRIDTGPWTQKGKNAKAAIGKAWAKFFHTEAIPGVKADNPYFVVACKETQRWGNVCSISNYIVFVL